MELSVEQIKRIVEASLLMNREPQTAKKLAELFTPEENINERAIVDTLTLLTEDYRGRGIELIEVATGYRFQVCADLAPWIQRTMTERPQRYSRALLETLALIAYRQPITRAEIEEIRGVVVSTQIMRTLEEREWVRVIGHRDVPGRPALYATTKQFLNDLNLKSLGELPTLAELQDLDKIDGEFQQLNLDIAIPQAAESQEANSATAESEANQATNEADADMMGENLKSVEEVNDLNDEESEEAEIIAEEDEELSDEEMSEEDDEAEIIAEEDEELSDEEMSEESEEADIIAKEDEELSDEEMSEESEEADIIAKEDEELSDEEMNEEDDEEDDDEDEEDSINDLLLEPEEPEENITEFSDEDDNALSSDEVLIEIEVEELNDEETSKMLEQEFRKNLYHETEIAETADLELTETEAE